jgi:hypothetical protein
MKLINKISVILAKIRIGFLHATFQRNMRNANIARNKHDIVTFKKHIYQAEDAWRKIVILTQKIKTNG